MRNAYNSMLSWDYDEEIKKEKLTLSSISYNIEDLISDNDPENTFKLSQNVCDSLPENRDDLEWG